MKKMISILIALALMLSLGSFCVAEDQDLTGEWYADVLGMPFTLVLNEDGTYSTSVAGENDEGVWVVEGDQLIMDKGEDDEGQLTISEGALTLADDGMEFIFTREPVTALEVPAAVAAESILDFDGTYAATMLAIPMEESSMVIDIESAKEQGLGELIGADDRFSMTIENGSVVVFGEDAQEFTFADGKLTLSDSENPDLDQSVELLEDGTVAYTLMGMQIVFAAQTAQ